ncbi:MAG: tRNA (adenosine(37)-N6)-threonylcarbamoyltransferase complex transferase subunit TsaD [bacterium]|nr:tRNA (adenosine(37)-N6)-threonylcarbamoyltransferase complex transferase subunit TsaD [bacterium]
MILLGIETSCDETALSIIESENGKDITVLADKTLSQIELHKQYGGVFPNEAKREHSRNLIPVLKTVLLESNLISNSPNCLISNENREKLNELLNREPEMLEQFLEFIPTIEKPPLDAIAVTEGPGLEPCLWTGINLAKALSLVWDIPIVPVNHMEGHIFSALLRRKDVNTELGSKNSGKAEKEAAIIHNSDFILHEPALPALALLISGGHTELVLVKNQFEYEIIGQTRDDAVGEAFDKVARLLGLPYPGGPEISAFAEEARVGNSSFIKGGGESPSRRILNPSPQKTGVLPLGKGELRIELPRPMLHSDDFDFSFSGIKTSVLYLIKKLPELTEEIKKEIALEFENAVTEVLIAKTKKALEQYGAGALLLGGGVVANIHIRREFENLAAEQNIPIHVPEKNLTTDNALMIAVAGLLRSLAKKGGTTEALRAKGNLRLDSRYA